MTSLRLPFAQVPHTTRLFLDYLRHAPAVRPFYPRSAVFSEWVQDEARHVNDRVHYDEARRAQVSAVLERQNRAWGASAKALANIERLRRGAVAAVTGQQVGLFGGPLFSIFKALTAVKLAEQATAAGVECVPIFWLATEDHDLAEVNHVALAVDSADPEVLTCASHSVTAAPVGTVRFGPEVDAVVERAAALLGDSEVSSWLRQAYRPGETLGSAFGRLFARLFADWGVILLDPSDDEFHQLAQPLFRAALERAPELDDALLARGQAIEAAGYHQQVKVTAASTLLFAVKNGARTVVHRQHKAHGQGDFTIGGKEVSAAELLRQVEASPGQFSPNALFRPVVQDYLLPTLAYTGGAAEIAYFAQAAVVYEKLLGRVTPILPRFSATLIEPKPQRLLTRYQLSLSDVLLGPDKVRETIAAQSLAPDLQARFSGAYSEVERSMTALREAIGKLDSTLIAPADKARMGMWHRIRRLHLRAARAELLRDEVIVRHADALNHALFPHKALQEREVAGVSFVARYGPQMLADLYPLIDPDHHDHHAIQL